MDVANVGVVENANPEASRKVSEIRHHVISLRQQVFGVVPENNRNLIPFLAESAYTDSMNLLQLEQRK